MFAIARGSGDKARAGLILNLACTLLLCCAGVLMVIGLLFARPILVLFGASPEALPDGILIKAVNDDGNGNNESLLPDAPSNMVTAVTELIQKNYPNARIIEIEQEKGMIEVDIIHENQSKEVLLSTNYEWISTSWDVYVLPVKVTDAIKASQYSGYVVDDAEYFETPAGNYYWIELEQGEKEVKVKINEDGQFI